MFHHCTSAPCSANVRSRICLGRHLKLEFLERAFVTVRIKRRGSSNKAPEVFRFDTTRFIGKLRIPENISTDDPLYQIQFEVQVPSAFEHAWSVTTHALTYKGEHVEWNRFRLAAQLKAAVEQLDILILAFEETSSKISASFQSSATRKYERSSLSRIELFIN
jgi:hypothetical protein